MTVPHTNALQPISRASLVRRNPASPIAPAVHATSHVSDEVMLKPFPRRLVDGDVDEAVFAATEGIDTVISDVGDEDIADFVVRVVALVVGRPRPLRVGGEINTVTLAVSIAVVAVNRQVANRDKLGRSR